MTKRLKKRFVMFTMTAVTCLLLFIVIAINALNWVMMERQSDTLLDVLVDMDSSFHKPETNRPFPFARPMNADRMRSSHFFVVRIDSSGNILDVNTDQITSLDTADAEDLASKAIAAGKTSGKVEEFKYAVKQIGTDRLLFFIDTSAQSDSFYRVLLASGAIAVLCWVLLLIIVLLLSGKVLRPVLNGMEKQKQFITNAGHEMKTPLAIIRSNNDTMALIHGENKYNTHIRAQTLRLNALMTNLLTLAGYDEERPLSKEAVNVSNILREMLPIYQEEAEKRGIRLEQTTASDVVIRTHADSIRQLFSILLDNAVKYTPADGRISVTLEKNGRHVRFIEENTCDTDREPDPERLFERFYRGDRARTQKEDNSGFGIGLSAARAACENLGGTLKAEYPSETDIRFIACL